MIIETLQFGPLQQKFIRETISNNNPMDRGHRMERGIICNSYLFNNM